MQLLVAVGFIPFRGGDELGQIGVRQRYAAAAGRCIYRELSGSLSHAWRRGILFLGARPRFCHATAAVFTGVSSSFKGSEVLWGVSTTRSRTSMQRSATFCWRRSLAAPALPATSATIFTT